MPLPGSIVTFSIGFTVSLKPANALAIGCSEKLSSCAASRNASASLYWLFTSSTRSMVKRPCVKVPVLSKAISVNCGSVSKTWACLIKIPRFVRLATAHVRAVGIAKLSAQGQVATSTEIVTQKACSGSI